MPAFEWKTNATRDTVQFVRRNTKKKKRWKHENQKKGNLNKK